VTRALTFLATAALLLVGLTVAVPAAQAAPPVPTTTVLTVVGGDRMSNQVVLTAVVTSASGTPTGSVTFSDGEQTAVVPVDASGKATITGQTGDKYINTFTATFTGTSGYGNSSASVTKAIEDAIIWGPEPTIARLSPTLKLTLNFATYVHDRDGQPLVGQRVEFSLLGKVPSLYETPKASYPVCEAVADATGLATCKGQISALLGSILSLLLGGAYATEKNGFFPGEQFTKLPVVLG
jgi:hypothetical protein